MSGYGVLGKNKQEKLEFKSILCMAGNKLSIFFKTDKLSPVIIYYGLKTNSRAGQNVRSSLL